MCDNLIFISVFNYGAIEMAKNHLKSLRNQGITNHRSYVTDQESYDELKKILENWLAGNTTDDTEPSATQETLGAKAEKSVSDSFDFDTKPHQLDDEIPTSPAPVTELPWDNEKPAVSKTQAVADAFEDLFK